MPTPARSSAFGLRAGCPPKSSRYALLRQHEVAGNLRDVAG